MPIEIGIGRLLGVPIGKIENAVVGETEELCDPLGTGSSLKRQRSFFTR